MAVVRPLTCARAVDLGLPAVAFTEHADYTTWIVLTRDLEEHEHLKTFATPDGSLAPPNLDLEGYLECVQRCRDKFRDLRIIPGVELGEPHWHRDVAARSLDWDGFAVLPHIDYAVRYWPAEAGRCDPNAFEDEYRHALRALADSGRALEIYTKTAPQSLSRYGQIVRWWRDEGGKVVTFGSDAHDPTAIAHRFAEAVALVEAHGFRPGQHPYDLWTRSV